MGMLAKKTSGGRWGTPLSASWTEQAYLGQHHCNPLLIVGVSKTANAGSPVSEKNSSRKPGEQARLPTPRYRRSLQGGLRSRLQCFFDGCTHQKIRLREFYKFLDKPYYFRPCLICWLLFAHHKNRAVGVAHDGIGNATQQRSPYTAQVSATHNNETSTYLLRQSSNLRVSPSYSEMGLCHIASSGFDLPYLLVE